MRRASIVCSFVAILAEVSLGMAADDRSGPKPGPPPEQREVQPQEGAKQNEVARDTPVEDGFTGDELMASVGISYLRGNNACVASDGTENHNLPFAALAPVNQVGRTRQEQPSLHWYLPGMTSCPVILTLIDGRPGKPLLEVTLPPPRTTGVQRVRLADYDVHLRSGTRYQWSISLVLDLNDRAKDLTVSGLIERAEPSTFSEPFLKTGLWYDVLAAASDQIEARPADLESWQQRATVLEQIEEFKGIAAEEVATSARAGE